MTRIVFLSDTHTYHHRLDVPNGDIVVHSGDYSSTGTIPEVNDFLTWFSELPHRSKIFINGNHERVVWKNPALFRALIPSNTIYLEDSEIIVDGLKFYGSPHTKEFCSWAYPYFNEQEAEKIWAKIPSDTDVLVTHMPPYGIRDGAPYMIGREGLLVPCLDEEGFSVGCEALREKVFKIKPKIHVYGHIHEGSGTTELNNTIFINASICDGQYRAINPITVVDIENDNVVNIQRNERT